MTHDELLAKIDRRNHSDGEVLPVSELRNALRAVVELHSGTGVSNRCVSCLHGNPCETIQAIEKELS